MANKNLFTSYLGKFLPKTTTRNSEQAPAYLFTPKHMLAQYAATGCLTRTFYASAGEQLEQVLALCAELDAEWIAKTAIYARKSGYMKDMPALLCAILSVKDGATLKRVFHRVIDNGKMLRNFVQIMRSGAVGRKSLGSLPKNLVLEWLDNHSDRELFIASVGNTPSLADIIKMVHPHPSSEQREALYAYLIGKTYEFENLPYAVRRYEAFKEGSSLDIPDVPFQMLTSLPLGRAEWAHIARSASWQTARMNLNTFARHGVFEENGMTSLIAARLMDEKAIASARVFPYQLLAAYLSCDATVPYEVRDALHDAMEIATANIPQLDGKVYICPDVSGSMGSPATGYRKGATTTIRCIDVAALVAAAILRRNPTADVLPFEQTVVKVNISGRDSIMTNAQRLAAIGGGGTNCSAPLRELNQRKAKGDLVVFISDNESWVDARSGSPGTAMMQEWNIFKNRNPQARLVCLDIIPNKTTQTAEREDILNIGGFSDQVFTVLSLFAEGQYNAEHWIGEIESIAL